MHLWAYSLYVCWVPLEERQLLQIFKQYYLDVLKMLTSKIRKLLMKYNRNRTTMQTISRRVVAFPCIDVHLLLFLHIAIVIII